MGAGANSTLPLRKKNSPYSRNFRSLHDILAWQLGWLEGLLGWQSNSVNTPGTHCSWPCLPLSDSSSYHSLWGLFLPKTTASGIKGTQSGEEPVLTFILTAGIFWTQFIIFGSAVCPPYGGLFYVGFVLLGNTPQEADNELCYSSFDLK